MRALTILVWIWRIGIAAIWVASVLGYSFSSLGINWLVSVEVWLTNHFPDPILFAFFTGLLFSSWALPAAWAIFERIVLGADSARTKLAEIRTSGVGIRNEATDEHHWLTDAEWLDWESRVEAWTGRAILAIGKLSKADAEWFRTLDTVPPPRVEMSRRPWGGEVRRHAFAMFDYRLLRLDQLIQQFRHR